MTKQGDKIMKLKEYIKHLTKLTKTHPEVLNMEVVSSSDDESNSFNKIVYAPSMGHFDNNYNQVCLN